MRDSASFTAQVFTGSDNQAPVSLVAMASKLEAMQALLEKELAVIKQNMTNMAATVSVCRRIPGGGVDYLVSSMKIV